jgi:hypothetical protein
MTQTHAQPWPTQLTLPGQAAAPEGPVDMVNMYVFHFAFRRDLGRFLEVVPRTPVEDAAAWRRLAGRWDLFADQLHHHHEAEDAVLWPWLRERVAGDDVAVLDAMAAEHDAIDPALAAVAPAFQALTAGPDAQAKADLLAALAEAHECLDRHLAHEETDAIRIMQAVMSDADWKALEKRFGEGQPTSGILVMVPWALDGLAPRDLDAVLGRAPLPMRLMRRVLAPGFARREREVFGS